MDTNIDKLTERYRAMPEDRLIRIASKEFDGLHPEAQSVVTKELQSRNLSQHLRSTATIETAVIETNNSPSTPPMSKKVRQTYWRIIFGLLAVNTLLHQILPQKTVYNLDGTVATDHDPLASFLLGSLVIVPAVLYLLATFLSFIPFKKMNYWEKRHIWYVLIIIWYSYYMYNGLIYFLIR